MKCIAAVACLSLLSIPTLGMTRQLQDQRPLMTTPPRAAEPAKRAPPVAAEAPQQAGLNRARSGRNGAGYYKPVEVCRGDGERDVIVGSGSTNPGSSPVTTVGSLTVVDRPTCPARAADRAQ